MIFQSLQTTFSRVTIEGYPEMYAIKTSTGRYLFCDKHSYRILSGLDNESTKNALGRYYRKHYEGKEFPCILTNPPDTEHVCTFINPSSGKALRAFSLAGLEYLCHNVTGKLAEENKPRILKLIKTFRESIVQQETSESAAEPFVPSLSAISQVQALVVADSFNEQVRQMARVMAEKDLERERAKHKAEMELEKTRNDSKMKDMEIELQRAKHETERVQWELKAAEIRQAQRQGNEASSGYCGNTKPIRPPSQQADVKAAPECLWLALYGAKKRLDAVDFNQNNTFVKACSSVIVEDDTWIALLELERPMVFAELAKEMELLAKKV
jgi:hypothetical protein